MNHITVKDKDNSITKIYLPGHLSKEIEHDMKSKRGKCSGQSNLDGKRVDEEAERERIEVDFLSYYNLTP